MWINDRCEAAVDWAFDNLSGCFMVGLGLLMLGIIAALGVSMWQYYKAPTTIERVASKRQFITTAWISNGKTLTPIVTENFVFTSEAGHECYTSGAEYAARNQGELQPCKWSR